MPRAASRKDVFVAGQIDQEARGDRFKALYLAGVATATNYRILNGRGIRRRPGCWRRLAITNGQSVGCEFTTDSGGIYKLIFSNTKLDVIQTDGLSQVIAQTLTGQPWTTEILDDLCFTEVDNAMVVTHTSFWPRSIAVDASGVWTVTSFAFASAPGSATAQPYWDYQTEGVTLAPSALTGSGITLTASAAHFVAGHVGTIFRYHGREAEIQTVAANGLTATADVLQDLPPTVTVILTDSRGFLVDGSVQGLDSTAKGVITARTALAGSGATFAAVPNGSSLWDGGASPGNVTISAGGTGYVSGLVSVAAHYMLRGVQNTIVATTVTVAAGAITAVVFPATEEGFKPWAADVTFTLADTQLTIAMKDGLTGFVKGEYLVSAEGNSKSIIGVGPTNTTPAAVLDWDEQAFSSVRGYPGSACFHRKRLYLLNWRDVPRAFTGSAAGFPDYFRIGTDDGDAFLELLPDFKGQRGLHMMSGDQGLILTDKAAYFLPEFGQNVVTPSTVEFKLIAPTGASSIKPVGTEQGFMYVEAGTKRIIGLIATGQVQIPWEAADISAYWTELMTGPRALAADLGITDRPERYSYVVQDDGSVAVMRAEPVGSDVPLGWTTWSLDDASVRSMFAAEGSLWAIAEHTDGTWLLVEFDNEIYLDLAEQFGWVSSSTGTAIEAVATGGNFGNQPANDGVEVISDNAADTTQTFTIIGTTNGGNTVVVETGTLNGTTQVATTKADWGVILAVKLSAAAAGTVTVREASGNATITTIAAGSTSAGVTAVSPVADQDALDVPPTVVAAGASTKVVGIQYTEAFGTDVRYQAATLTGTTAVAFPYAANLVTEVYNGDVATATAITVKVGTPSLTNYASAEVEVMSEGHWRHGEFTVTAGGVIDLDTLPEGEYVAGFDMTTRLTFLAPTVEHPAYEDGRRHSIPVAHIKVDDASTYSVNGVLNSAYRAGENTDAAPTLRTETKRWGIMGRGETLAPDITQTIPSPLTVLGAQLRVHF